VVAYLRFHQWSADVVNCCFHIHSAKRQTSTPGDADKDGSVKKAKHSTKKATRFVNFDNW